MPASPAPGFPRNSPFLMGFPTDGTTLVSGLARRCGCIGSPPAGPTSPLAVLIVSYTRAPLRTTKNEQQASFGCISHIWWRAAQRRRRERRWRGSVPPTRAPGLPWATPAARPRSRSRSRSRRGSAGTTPTQTRLPAARRSAPLWPRCPRPAAPRRPRRHQPKPPRCRGAGAPVARRLRALVRQGRQMHGAHACRVAVLVRGRRGGGGSGLAAPAQRGRWPCPAPPRDLGSVDVCLIT